MAEIKSYRDLIAWQKTFVLGLSVYKATQKFPDREKYGITSQLCRSAISVASNIAEGYGRGSSQDYIRFLRIARGSLYEMDTQLLFALKLGYLTPDQHETLQSETDECGRILAGRIRSLET